MKKRSALRLILLCTVLWSLCTAVQAGMPVYMPKGCAPAVPPDLNKGFDPYQHLPNNATMAGIGQLSGVVVDSSDRPLRGAEIQLECGLDTYSGGDGRFFIDNVPAGTQRVRIHKAGYNIGQGKVTITAGNVRTLKVSLSPAQRSKTPAAAQPQYGYFIAAGDASYTGPRERRAWVYKIEVNDRDDLSRTWQNTWWEDYGDNRFELKCDGAVIGHYYRIKLTWRRHGKEQDLREASDDFDVQFTRDGQEFLYKSCLESE